MKKILFIILFTVLLSSISCYADSWSTNIYYELTFDVQFDTKVKYDDPMQFGVFLDKKNSSKIFEDADFKWKKPYMIKPNTHMKLHFDDFLGVREKGDNEHYDKLKILIPELFMDFSCKFDNLTKRKIEILQDVKINNYRLDYAKLNGLLLDARYEDVDGEKAYIIGIVAVIKITEGS